jgi:hypothetical protein
MVFETKCISFIVVAVVEEELFQANLAVSVSVRLRHEGRDVCVLPAPSLPLLLVGLALLDVLPVHSPEVFLLQETISIVIIFLEDFLQLRRPFALLRTFLDSSFLVVALILVQFALAMSHLIIINSINCRR